MMAAENEHQLGALWAILVRRAVEREDQMRLQEAVAMVGEARVKRMVLRRRVVLDKPTFREMMYALFDGDEALRGLRKMGVVRERSDSFELWSADDVMTDPVMQKILDTAQRASNVRQARAFHVFLSGEVPLVYPWVSSMTLATVQGIISETLHLSPSEYVLLHLGKRVKGKRTLKDQGIVPGSFLRLVR